MEETTSKPQINHHKHIRCSVCSKSMRSDSISLPEEDAQSVQLRPWQRKLVKIRPTQRHVIWIWGSRGNEGKSWFQSYLETFYGFSRVVRLDLRNKTSNILYALSKRPLQTTDIFLFNDTRASDLAVLECINCILKCETQHCKFI